MPRIKGKNDMSDSALDNRARRWVTSLEDAECVRRSESLPGARARIAKRIGVSTSSLERMRNGRTKGVKAWLYEKIRALVVEEMQA